MTMIITAIHNQQGQTMTESTVFHAKAKEAGNRLSTYVTNYASAASGLFFWALVQDSATRFSPVTKVTAVAALALYVATAAIRLFELHIDAKRFYACAKETEKADYLQDWSIYQAYSRLRLRLIYSSYLTLSGATVLALVFMVLRLA